MKFPSKFHNLIARVVISLLLALAALAPGAVAPHVARAAGTYVVDTNLDAPDSGLLDGDCISTLGGCTLRAAIEQAGAPPGPTTINFTVAMQNQTIVLSDTLGTILWTGSAITVAGGLVTVSGASLSGNKNLFEISGSNNTLLGLRLEDAPGSGVKVGDLDDSDSGNDNRLQYLRITGSGGPAIIVSGSAKSGGAGNLIFYNYIGLSDSDALGCTPGDGNGSGVVVAAAAIGTQLNGNFVGCSTGAGVTLDGTLGAPTDTLLTQNRIGVNSAGAPIPNGGAGVSILAGTRGVTLANNYIGGNSQQGVAIGGDATGQITITQNNIGTNFFGNLSVPNGLDGILITGLDAAGTRINAHPIACYSGAGIHFAGCAGVTVTNNFIGLNPAGNSIMFNFTDGVRLDAGANHNLIGGTQAAAKNVIAGNGGNGVLMDGAATTLNQVSGNFIGTNISGTLAIPNLGSGVRLDHGAHHNLVGSHVLDTQRNVISGNAGYGVYLLAGAHDNTVDGNFIGLTASGLAGLGNGSAGVAIISSPSNALASAGANTGQYISANTDEGIYVYASASTYIGWTNYIGVGFDLTTALGNGADGIRLDDATNSSLQAGLVANNHGAGVAVVGASAAGNKIFFYDVRNNTGLPIDLNADGRTLNDPGDADAGPNLLQNYPAITAVAGTVVTGTTCALCTVFIYHAYGNPAGPGGGGFLIGTAFATAAGVWSFAFLPPGMTRFDLTASACDTAPCVVFGNTSEMSPRWQQILPAIFRP
jgi:hypothetical protein